MEVLRLNPNITVRKVRDGPVIGHTIRIAALFHLVSKCPVNSGMVYRLIRFLPCSAQLFQWPP